MSFFILDLVYEASTRLIVNKKIENKSVQMNVGDHLKFCSKTSSSIGEIIKSRTVITSKINRVNIDSTYEDILQVITVINVADTQIIKI